MTAVSVATDGLFCDTPPLSVSNGQVWDGLFCVEGVITEQPSGGGGTVSAPGNYYNQTPPVIKDAELYLDQALVEDEELIIMLKAFAEVIRWH